MRNILYTACLALGFSAQAPNAAIVSNLLFSDNFDAEMLQFNTSLANWNVLQGSVDVVGNCAGTGRCVDIDGSMGATLPTIIETTLAFEYISGRTYTLDFSIPTGTQADPIRFSYGSVLERAYTGYTFPLQDSISAVAGADGLAPLRIALESITNNNFGPYLTSISLTETFDDAIIQPAPIPLPASAPLLLGGLLVLQRMTRNRR